MQCFPEAAPTAGLNWKQPVTWNKPHIFTQPVRVSGSLSCRKIINWNYESRQNRLKSLPTRQREKQTSKSIVGNAVRYGSGRGISPACLIHNCFPSFWSETWKREFCPEKKQNGWTHQYPDNTRLPIQQVCAAGRETETPHFIKTVYFNGRPCIGFICIVLFFYVGFMILLFLCSAPRRKHSEWKGFPQTWILCMWTSEKVQEEQSGDKVDRYNDDGLRVYTCFYFMTKFPLDQDF